MERRTRRILLLAAGAIAVWYLVVVLAWAVRPLSDSIPVGTDNTLKQPHLVSTEVQCNSLFDETPSNGLLAVLKPQPKGAPPLAYQRPACTAVQRDARIIFGLDSLGTIAAIGLLLYIALRRPRHPAGSHRDPAPSYA